MASVPPPRMRRRRLIGFLYPIAPLCDAVRVAMSGLRAGFTVFPMPKG